MYKQDLVGTIRVMVANHECRTGEPPAALLLGRDIQDELARLFNIVMGVDTPIRTMLGLPVHTIDNGHIGCASEIINMAEGETNGDT